MKKTIRKNTQLSLINPKGAGRKPIHDKGIRHTEREELKNNTVLHLTIKIARKKAALKNKNILKVLHHAIKKSRLQGLKIIHYTLEFDHIHLMVEASDKKILGKGMQSFGITLSKGINKVKNLSGNVFKTRYHFRKLHSPNEIRNAINYIFSNGIKHKEATSILSPYNSLASIEKFQNIYPGFEIMIEESIRKSVYLSTLKENLRSLLESPKNYHLNLLVGT